MEKLTPVAASAIGRGITIRRGSLPPCLNAHVYRKGRHGEAFPRRRPLGIEAGMDGLETFRRMRRLRPDQRAIILSGYVDDQKVKPTRPWEPGHL